MNRVEALENAVINKSPEDLAAFIKMIGMADFSARALGLACRFRGPETVKVLVENGADFDIPKTEETEKRYTCYAGRELKKMRSDNYRSNYALCLLNIFQHIKGACCFKGVKLVKQVKREDNAALKLLPDEERLKVLKYLCENKERLSFYPSEMLYYAIFGGDDFIVTELKKSGITLSEERKKIIINGGLYTDSYWYEYCSMTGKLSDEDYLRVMKGLAAELDGKKFHCTEITYEITKGRFVNKEIFEFFRDNFDHDKLNKTKIIRDLIDQNSADLLPLAEEMGWLGNIKRRDEMIKYSQDIGRPECTAFLLSFKNRTADFAAEREKEERKMLAELNASPNSVKMLQKTWSFKKWEEVEDKSVINGDGKGTVRLSVDLADTLTITNYKGVKVTEVIVPEKIGKRIVTVIGNGAFAAASGIGAGQVTANFTHEQMMSRRLITKITLPNTLKFIGWGAFAFLKALKSIEIPEGVEQIAPFAFDECGSLTEITVPGSVKKIGKYAFASCGSLKSVKLCEGVLEIGAGVFNNDPNLTTLILPKSLKRFVNEETRHFTVKSITSLPKLTVYCPKGSCAEDYCKLHGIKYSYISEEL